MQPRKTNIAARAARWSATHRKVAIFGWLAFVVLSIAVGGAVGQKQLTDAEAVSGESGRAELALERAELNPNDELVLVQSNRFTASDPEFEAAVDEATRRLEAVPSVEQLSSPVGGGGQVSADGHAALIEFEVPGDKTQAEERVNASLAATAVEMQALLKAMCPHVDTITVADPRRLRNNTLQGFSGLTSTFHRAGAS